MAQNSVNRVIKFFSDQLTRSGIRVTRMILFGSHAANTARSDSDIDIALVSPDFSGVDLLDRIPMICDAEWQTVNQFHIPLDIILLDPDEYESERSIRMDFIHKGIIQHL